MCILNSICRTMKNRFIIYTLLFALVSVSMARAQANPELADIQQSAKVLYVKPDALDRLMIRLRAIENNIRPEDGDQLEETYRTIAEQYIANNHYSQAYQVYLKLVQFKDEFAAKNYEMALDSTVKNIEQRRINDGTELMNLQNQVQQLQIDNDLLVSKRINFKKYFSFIIIALSTIFALMLVRTALKLIKIRSQLKENRAKMKANHRLTTLGSFVKGIVNQSRQKVGEIEDDAGEIAESIKTVFSDDKSSPSLINDIRSNCKSIIKELNSSGIEA